MGPISYRVLRYTWLEVLDIVEHSSLLGPFISYEKISVIHLVQVEERLSGPQEAGKAGNHEQKTSGIKVLKTFFVNDTPNKISVFL
jgi:hypothetical protein